MIGEDNDYYTGEPQVNYEKTIHGLGKVLQEQICQIIQQGRIAELGENSFRFTNCYYNNTFVKPQLASCFGLAITTSPRVFGFELRFLSQTKCFALIEVRVDRVIVNVHGGKHEHSLVNDIVAMLKHENTSAVFDVIHSGRPHPIHVGYSD